MRRILLTGLRLVVGLVLAGGSIGAGSFPSPPSWSGDGRAIYSG